jgi:L-asparaginase II
VAVVDGGGSVLYALGDISVPVHLRSTAKPFQLLPFVSRKLHERYQLDGAELALLMGSHGGESQHINCLTRLMPKLAIESSELLCGAHAPMHDASRVALIKADLKPTVLHNNCSGKHCAMLATCKSELWSTNNYIDASHPLQKEIVAILSEVADLPSTQIGLGIDGCSATTHILPLKNLALAYAALAYPKLRPRFSSDLQVIFDAGVKHPEMIAGTKRLDSALIRVAKQKIFAKTGAEGAYALAVAPNDRYPRGLGIALKIADGDFSHRARNIVVTDLLRQLELLGSAEILGDEELSKLDDGRILNARSIDVGEIRPMIQL